MGFMRKIYEVSLLQGKEDITKSRQITVLAVMKYHTLTQWHFPSYLKQEFGSSDILELTVVLHFVL